MISLKKIYCIPWYACKPNQYTRKKDTNTQLLKTLHRLESHKHRFYFSFVGFVPVEKLKLHFSAGWISVWSDFSSAVSRTLHAHTHTGIVYVWVKFQFCPPGAFYFINHLLIFVAFVVSCVSSALVWLRVRVTCCPTTVFLSLPAPLLLTGSLSLFLKWCRLANMMYILIFGWRKRNDRQRWRCQKLISLLMWSSSFEWINCVYVLIYIKRHRVAGATHTHFQHKIKLVRCALLTDLFGRPCECVYILNHSSFGAPYDPSVHIQHITKQTHTNGSSPRFELSSPKLEDFRKSHLFAQFAQSSA